MNLLRSKIFIVPILLTFMSGSSTHVLLVESNISALLRKPRKPGPGRELPLTTKILSSWVTAPASLLLWLMSGMFSQLLVERLYTRPEHFQRNPSNRFAFWSLGQIPPVAGRTAHSELIYPCHALGEDLYQKSEIFFPPEIKVSKVASLNQLLSPYHLSYWNGWGVIWKLTSRRKFSAQKIRAGQL